MSTHQNNNTAHFKGTSTKNLPERYSSQLTNNNAGQASVIAIMSNSNRMVRKNESSSNSLVVIDGVESPVPKIIQDTGAGHASKPSGTGFALQQICN